MRPKTTRWHPRLRTLSYLALPIAALAAFLLVCLFHAPPEGAMAYLTGRDGTENDFTAGVNTSQVVEQFSQSSLTTGANTFEKEVAVQNTGDIPCYVRVFLAFSDSSICGISELSADGVNFYPEADFRTHLNAGWVYGGDGYYYYEMALSPGEETTDLLRKITTTFPEGAKIRDYEIIVYEESVQTRSADGTLLTGEDACQQAFSDFLSFSGGTQGSADSQESSASADLTGNST